MSKSLPTNKPLSITKTAKLLSVSPDTLRRLEKKGKFTPNRTAGGKRIYTKANIEFLKHLFNRQESGPFNVKQAASILGVSIDTIRRWENEGRIIASRTAGGHRRFTKETIEQARNLKGKQISISHSPTSVASDNKPTFSESPFIDEFPNLYDQLPPAQKKIIKAGSFMTLVMLLLFVFTRFGPLKKGHVSQYIKLAQPLIHGLVVKYPALGKIIPEDRIASYVYSEKETITEKILGLVSRADTYNFNVAVESNFAGDLNVDGVATLASANVTDAFDVTGAFQINSVAVTSSATELNYLDDLTLAAGGVVYSTATGLSISAAGSADQVLTSAGTSVPTWKSASDLDVGTIGGIAGDSFLRSDTSDSFTSGVLDFSDGTLFDLSAILHNDSGVQGLKLPQYTSLTAVTTGEGFLAYDTDDDTLQVFNGTTWTSVGGVAGAGTAGQVTFWTDTDTISSDSGFLYDSATDILSIGSGGAVNPTVNLGSDLGSSSLRWNNLYVGTINTNATLDITGQALFTYDPADTTYTEASVLINPTAPETNEWMWATGEGGYQRAGIDVEGDLTLGYNDAVSAPNNANPLSIYNHGSSEIFSVDTTGNTIIAGDVTVTGGEILFNPISSAAVTTTSEGNVYYDSTIDHLMVYGSDAAFHRIAMDMTQYSASDASVSNQSYVEIAHGQTTNDLSITGWVYNSITSLWTAVTERLAKLVKHNLDNEFNPEFTQQQKVTRVTLEYEENNLGDGTDGAITVSSNSDINTTALISGRSASCLTAGENGDAVNYQVSSLTPTTATLTTSPDDTCLLVGDEVLLINLQGTSSAYTNVGNWETLRVQGISGTEVTFTTAKTKFYGSGVSDDNGMGTGDAQNVILQRVPNYTSVTIDSGDNFYPSDFNGSKSGVMFFRATGAVTINGTGKIHANAKGYRGGAAGVGGDGGEAFCNGDGGGDGGQYNSDSATAGLCGGGGGGGAYGNNSSQPGKSGSASLGGGGGAGGRAYDTSGDAASLAGGGGGAGYGTFGTGGKTHGLATPGTAGGTNTSGAGGAGGYDATYGASGGGGGGGTYGDENLTDLMFGSGGGEGGYDYPGSGPDGGDGGGIVYIAADDITVTGYLTANGANGADSGYTYGGGSGGGAGGSIKIVGDTINVGGSTRTTATGGVGGADDYDGGDGGDGRIAIGYGASLSNTTDPVYTSITLEYNPYAIYVGEEVHTPGTTAFNNISWTEDLDTNGEIQIQTRSGATADSTDGSWEAWKPTTSSTSLQTANTHTDWSGTNATVSEGDVARNVDFFEDEDESNSGNLTKITATSDNGYAEATISSTDVSGRDYIALWVRSSAAGEILTVGLGESAATEETQDFYINQADSWQKIFWDITDFTSSSCTGSDNCDAVTKLRVTVNTSGVVVYIDSMTADSYLTTPGGSTITSTAANYIQYRAILSTTNALNAPTLSVVGINLTNPDGTTTIDANSIVDPNETIKNQTARRIDPEKLAYVLYDTGTGADGAITVNANTDINATPLISGRAAACLTTAQEGDAVNYQVSSLTSTTATLTSSPDTTCLSVGDEVLLINLQGTSSAYTNVGNWETLRVQGISGAVVTFTTAKDNYYGSGASDDAGISTGDAQNVILQRVPNYTSVTVDSGYDFYPSDFAGSKDGVLFFRATGAVTINGTGRIHAYAKGYRGGAAGVGDGGEAFCNGDGGGDGGQYNSDSATAGLCGGGGGGGGWGNNASYPGKIGSASLGGAGGGGGRGYDTSGDGASLPGGGAGGGYGTFGTGGKAWQGGAYNGTNGGTNTSGDGGDGYYDVTYGMGGGAGGGGTYGDDNLTDLMFGSGGGEGGYDYPGSGPDGGDGGGIVYIAADDITVTGYLTANGADGAASGYSLGAGSGGGAGGSIKIVGDTINVGGSTRTTATGGAFGDDQYDGGTGGDGRIALYYVTSIANITDPTYVVDTASEEYNPYKAWISNEIATTGATSFTNIAWTEDLDTNGEIQMQTRSGSTSNSTDDTWEDWKPTSTSLTLHTAVTEGEWNGTNATVADGDVTRNINYYEDEDEATSGNLVKVTATAANGYAEHDANPTTWDLTSYDYITFWARSTTAGGVMTVGIGETVATEEEQTISIAEADIWQKYYWDITNFDSSSCTGADGCNAADLLRFTTSENGNVFYIDDIKAESYLTTPGGSSITSTTNNYIQYRAILSTTNILNSPTLAEVRITYDDGSSQAINDRLSNQNEIDEYDNDTRLDITKIDLDDYKSVRITKQETGVTMSSIYNTGTGDDGDITVSSDSNINTIDLISGRSCSDGGDAPYYYVTALTSRTATLTQAPSSNCLKIGDEVLLINLQGTSSAFVNVGNHETLIVENIENDYVTFTNAKAKYYGSGPTDDNGISTGDAQNVMLQRVPNYNNVTVNTGKYFYPDDFNGSGGGVMFFRARGAVTVNGLLHTESKGYRGGSWGYGDGGEAFCNGDGGGDGGRHSTDTATAGLCGGGGGGGAWGNNASYPGKSGSVSLGGGGGGGGRGYDTTGDTYSLPGGGAGGGYGTFGTGGKANTTYAQNGSNGGTNSSGAGGDGGYDATYGAGGGGGGGGTYGDTNLDKLMFGSGGGEGGYNFSGSGPDGGDGGGIIYITADSITVSGELNSDGGDGVISGYTNGGGSGGGAGGSIKLVAKTINTGSTTVSGTYRTRSYGGTAANDYNDGGTGGVGRIAMYYGDTVSGTTYPSAQQAEVPQANYSLIVSDEIPTPDAVEYTDVTWRADETPYGIVQVQTRSGKSSNSTDNTWEAWRPVTDGTNYTTLESADTHTNWTASSSTLTVADGGVARDVNYFEDEDENTVANMTKLTAGANANTYAEARISSVDLSNYDFITAWVYVSTSGNVVKLGFGETNSNEHETLIKIDTANTWQKVYWDISHIPDHERDGVRNLRVTLPTTNYDVYIDNVEAERLLRTPEGSNITSTPNEYIQYRVILNSSKPQEFPTLYNIQVEWSDGYKIEQTDSDTVRLYNYTGDTQNLKLDVVVFGADLAEWYTVDDQSIMEGDLVSTTGELDEFGVPILTKATEENKNALVGAISTQAGKELGIPGDDRRLLALAGRIPVKIAPTSAEIQAGDFLGASNIEGQAEKLETGGITVGRALESWTPESGKETIKVMVGTSLYSPNSLLSSTGNVQIIKETPDREDSDEFVLAQDGGNLSASSDITKTDPIYSLLNESGDEIKGIAGVFSEATIANLKAGRIEADEIMINGSPLSEYLSQNLSGEFSAASSEADLKFSDLEARITLLEGESILGEDTADDSDSETDYSTLTILGKSTLSDTVVNGILDVGILSINNLNGSINSIGPLSLQPLSLGSILLQGESIEIDIQGNLIIKEGVIRGNENIRGAATLEAGENIVVIEKSWELAPETVVITPSYITAFSVTNLTDAGFTIEVEKTSEEDTILRWLAIW